MAELNVRLLIQAIDRVSAPVRQINQAFGKMAGKASAAARKASASMAGLETASRRVRDVGKSLALRVTLPIAGVGGAIIRTAANFESSMNRVRALTGATGDDFEGLEDLARKLGETTQFSASQAAEAMGNLAQAGFSVEEVLGALPATLQLAASANTDLGEAASIVSNVMRGYGLEVEDLGRINDVLVKAFTSANTDLSGLGQAMKFAGPIAAGLGIKFEETAAALGLLASAGFDATLGGTALRGAMSKLVNPTTEAIKVFGRLKIRKEDLLDSEGNLRSLIDVIGVLERQGAGAAELLEIFGDRAGPGMTALVEKGAASLAEFTRKLEESGGTAERVAKVQMEGAAGETRKLISAVEGLALAIAESGLLAAFTQATEKLTEWSASLAALNPAILKWGTILAGIAALIAPVLLSLGALGFAIKGLAVGWAVFNTAVLANPIGIAAVAVAAAAALIIANWDEVLGVLTRGWGALKDIFLGGAILIVDAVKGILGALPDFVTAKLGIDISAIEAASKNLRGLQLSARAEAVGAGAASLGRQSSAGGVLPGLAGTGRFAASERPPPTELHIRFANAPPGMRVETVRKGGVDPDVDVGMAMVGP